MSQYSLKSFLRKAPNSLLKRYLAGHRIGLDLQWDSINESKIEPIFEAIEAASDENRAEINADFGDIEAMATDGGVKTIIDEACFHKVNLALEFEKMEGHHERALWTFIEHKRIFEVAFRFNHADSLSDRSWKKTGKLPSKNPHTDEDSKKRLSTALASYFWKAQGRGKYSIIEHYKRNDLLYWFCYVQDFAQTSIEFDYQGNFDRRKICHAFEIIFTHSPAEHTLETYAHGGKPVVLDLQKIWARIIIDSEIEPEYESGVVYDLHGLIDKDFPLPLDPTGIIEDIRIKKLRLKFTQPGNQRITLEADVSDSKHRIYDLLDDLLDQESKDLVQVTLVSFQVKFRDDGRRGQRTLSFNISHPDSCNLKQDPRHLIVKDLLRRWKIDVSGNPDKDSEKD